MRISIMQPYIFPYIGYFQLIKASDIFVCLDDVNFIKRGWIHRNRLCFNGYTCYFTIPIEDSSQFRKINETRISHNEFEKWRDKFFSSLKYFYKKQQYFEDGILLAEMVLSSYVESIAELSELSLNTCCSLFGITTPIKYSSHIENINKLNRESRLIDICHKFQCEHYLNAVGGKNLYSREMFEPHGIVLEFLQPNIHPYGVKGRPFIPSLSILDAVMCCGKEYICQHLLSGYTIQEAA